MNGLESLWHTLKGRCANALETIWGWVKVAIEILKKKAPEVWEECKSWLDEVLGIFQKKGARALEAVRVGDEDALFALNLSNEQLSNIRGTQFAQGMTLLHWAAYHGRLNILDPLMAHGVDPDVRTPAGLTAMGLAAVQGHTQVILELARLGVAINAGADDKGAAPVEIAYAAKKISCVMALLQAGVDSKNILGAVSKMRDKATLAKLLEQGLSPNVRDGEGLTPLHHAVMSGSLSCVSMLLNAKADINAASSMGLLPIDCASKPSMLFDFLLQAGSRRQGTAGWSPEILATRARAV